MQENAAKTAAEWVLVARSVAQMPGGEAQAMRCMARAAVLAQGVEDWIALAKAWAQDFCDEEAARQCMGRAEIIAKTSDDWGLISFAWNDLVRPNTAPAAHIDSSNKEHQRENYDYSGTIANHKPHKNIHDWVEEASDWAITYSNPEKALECMTQAEALAESMLWTGLLSQGYGHSHLIALTERFGV